MDAGNYFKPLGPASRVVNELMMESLAELPLRVLNLAPGDLHLWEELNRLDDRHASRIISTNLMPVNPDVPAPRRYAILEVEPVRVRDGRPLRIGFLGVSDPQSVRPNSGFTGADVDRAVSETIQQIKDKADLIVVLADLSEEQAASLAANRPEIGLILRAERRYVRNDPRVINQTVVASSIERARYLGQMILRFDDSGKLLEAEPDLIELRAGVPEDPVFLEKEEAVNGRMP